MTSSVATMTEGELARIVWVERLRPLQFYHQIKERRTACDIPIVGYGHRMTLGQAKSEANQPCRFCYGG